MIQNRKMSTPRDTEPLILDRWPMLTSRPLVYTAAAAVFAICTYVFLDGNKVFEGRWENDLLTWYFFAKGIFCSLSLILARELLEAVRGLRQ